MASIVVGYEESEQAGRVLRRAATVAEALSATLIVVSVAAPSGRTELGDPAPSGRPDPIEGLIVPHHHPAGKEGAHAPEEPERRHALERARSALMGRSLEAEYVIEVGDSAERLLAVAVERGSELIVVGRREHGVLDRLLRRSTEETIARLADCDVLIVH